MFVSLLLALTARPASDRRAEVEGLTTEYLQNPSGVDATNPRLSWYVTSGKRGDTQTAYQVLVSSSVAGLKASRGDLWNSGKVRSEDFGTVFNGSRLASGETCFWKVRTWNVDGLPSHWSQPSTWTMGILHRSEWKAKWITSPLLAAPANRPRTPIHCYRSEISHDQNQPKWVSLDLGKTQSFNGIDLHPARPDNLTFDIGTVQFPVQFRLEASNDPTFKNSVVLFNTKGDYPEPRSNDCLFKFQNTIARYVRFYATKLGPWDASDYGIFLSRFEVKDGENVISIGAKPSASDSLESANWSLHYLTEATQKVEFCPFPAAIDPHFVGAFSPSRTAMLRRDFSLDSEVKKATLFSTARGFYEPRLNGHRVGDQLLSPGFTDYTKRISYQTFDVTSMLHKGSNTLGALLGYGWFSGHMNLGGNAYFYGYFPRFLAQLDIELANGKRLIVASDKSWKTSLDGDVSWSDILDGEARDFRSEQRGWDLPTFGDSAWKDAWQEPLGTARLVTQKTPPVRQIQLVKPIGKTEVKPGVWVYDLGQEMTGWVRIQYKGNTGEHLIVRHSEAIKADGELDTASLWGTPQQDDYILDGGGSRTLEPHFTYHGFRYFEISGATRAIADRDIAAMNIHTDNKEVSQFESDNPLYNHLMAASKWTERNLMFDVPAGCAARSERLAWTGDIRPCVQTMMSNFDATAFFEKYADDLRDDQKADGRFTDIAPHAHLSGTNICVGSPGWADAGVSLPWDVYVNTGDKTILKCHYEAQKKWVEFVFKNNPDFLWKNERGMDWGDWLSAGTATPKELGATAFFAHSTDLVARMARVLGKTADASKYASRFARIKAAFVAAYVSPDGTIAMPMTRGIDVKKAVQNYLVRDALQMFVNNKVFGGDPAPGVAKLLTLTYFADSSLRISKFSEDQRVDISGKNLSIVSATYGPDRQVADAQGSYALALQFGLLDEPLKSRAVSRLLQVIHRDGDHPSTGFWSSVEMVDALSDAGQNVFASSLVDLETAPSWGYMVTHGTTFWEAFDADKKTLSLNHWTHSSCGEWLWRNVAGLKPDENHAGYKRFIVHPRPSEQVSSCKSSYSSARGPIIIAWHQRGKTFTLDLTVPVGSVAKIHFPSRTGQVFEGLRAVVADPNVRFLHRFSDDSTYEVKSGKYRFRCLTSNQS